MRNLSQLGYRCPIIGGQTATYRALLMQIRLLHGENLRSLLSVAEGLVLAQERITQVDSFVIEQDEAPI